MLPADSVEGQNCLVDLSTEYNKLFGEAVACTSCLNFLIIYFFITKICQSALDQHIATAQGQHAALLHTSESS